VCPDLGGKGGDRGHWRKFLEKVVKDFPSKLGGKGWVQESRRGEIWE